MPISDEVLQQILLERERLQTPPNPMEKASGAGIARFIVSCNDASSVLSMAKEVMTIVNSHSTQSWLSLDEWSKTLPSRFVNGCSPELTEEEKGKQSERWDGLTYEEKIAEASHDDKWTLSSWLSWLAPEEREWFWWNAVLFDAPLNNSYFLIEVTALDFVFMHGALKWLFKACGAIDVISEDDL
ncbi:hypothetical protein ERHA54_45420 [Erwinia rhapontici]|uniref:Uncharacterized protein n=1 Tax=Erwinia rhapontici TaxID=55212 RepID=A0ABM7N621_ERWRD|nr:hypothetical protein [Erwinia rhapontici]BCQ36931.1 hypothetical protein ERHA53_42740 [Erwinia rhapontici]BCQ41939.1 hypothetical protein ERHA54_45420 [Erwinia rhapontici]BCQ47275.1 hypothetical protein ERHA55_48020 [Erwinia rhapontici]